MSRRWVDVWLTVFFGLPVLIAFLYVAVYQGLVVSKDFYWFWLGETFFYLGLPAVALATWRIHWGKRHPVGYALITLLMMIGIIYMGGKDWVSHSGEVSSARLVPLGISQDQLVTAERSYSIPYFPYDEDRLIRAVRQKEPVEVHQVEGKNTILAFAEEDYISYPWTERALDVGLGLLAAGVFTVFFLVAMGIWWRSYCIKGENLMITRWGRRTVVSLLEAIQIRLDREREEVRVETEEVVYCFPYEKKLAEEIKSAAVRVGLISLDGGSRWFRRRQYRELRIEPQCLLLISDIEEAIPLADIVSMGWEGAVRITTEEGSDYLVTDERYTDRAWFEELAKRVKRIWFREGWPYTVEVDPSSGGMFLTSHLPSEEER
ncbi:hypothetical protein [Paludifilum halophilum]|uniref:Uncharacterized protein n=1 Tax=Paludifilum halophilum TaxID=1642702 RepID=A0A235B3P2_9BACL|nr:hypothetical protein [Paludifilum halophilum]OYD06936.1 hypothetical protein CHM34_13430 [Paludifilum halophilum]